MNNTIVGKCVTGGGDTHGQVINVNENEEQTKYKLRGALKLTDAKGESSGCLGKCNCKTLGFCNFWKMKFSLVGH